MISPNVIFFDGPIHLPAEFGTLFNFLVEWWFLMLPILITCSSVDGRLDWFHLQAIVTKAAVAMDGYETLVRYKVLECYNTDCPRKMCLLLQ